MVSRRATFGRGITIAINKPEGGNGVNRYVYSVVQITPRISTGEFVNFAVVAGNDQLGDWALRRVLDTKRARRFCGIHAMTAAYEFVDTIEERIDSVDDRNQADWLFATSDSVDLPISEQFIDELSTWHRGVVRLSPPMPVLAESSEEALELLLPDLLVEPTTRVFRRITKKRLVADMRTTYKDAGIVASNLRARPALTVGKRRQFHLSADFAVATDHALQLCNAWSFQIADLEEVRRGVQAWGWNMRELRAHGGLLDDGQITVPNDVEVRVIVAPDPGSEGERALADAQLVFEEVEAVAVPYADRQRVAAEALKLVS